MPSLGDYIGRLVAEVATARAQADLEAARLAEIYRTHPLLANFPVPRFRLPTVNLEFPVVIETVPQPQTPPTIEEARLVVRGALTAELKRRGATLDDAEWAVVDARLEERVKTLVDDPRARASDLYVADALSDAASEALPAHVTDPLGREPGPGAGPEPGPRPVPRPLRPGGQPAFPGFAAQRPVIEDLRDAARLAVVAIRSSASAVEVKVTAAELAAVDPKTVVRVSLTLSEEGLEWSGDEQAGERLIPE